MGYGNWCCGGLHCLIGAEKPEFEKEGKKSYGWHLVLGGGKHEMVDEAMAWMA
jgi:hypothetical protein